MNDKELQKLRDELEAEIRASLEGEPGKDGISTIEMTINIVRNETGQISWRKKYKGHIVPVGTIGVEVTSIDNPDMMGWYDFRADSSESPLHKAEQFIVDLMTNACSAVKEKLSNKGKK